MSDTYGFSTEIDNVIEEGRIINTHCHISTDEQFENADLNLLFDKSYLNWVSDIPRDFSKSEDICLFVKKMCTNNYFYYLDKAVERIHGISLSSGKWKDLDLRISSAYNDKSYFLNELKYTCGYRLGLLDNCRNPGFDNNHCDIFRPVLRIDSLFLKGEDDYNDVSAERFVSSSALNDFNLYMKEVEAFISGKIERREVYAIKIASAYDFAFDFPASDEDSAKKSFQGKMPDSFFHSYLFDKVATICARYDVPLQIHTGIAPTSNTRAWALFNIIKSHPETKFVIFHGSFPWIDDPVAMLHLFKNVYVDICWMPLISTSYTIDFLKKILEVGNCDRICWGCDTRMFEESFAAILALKDVLPPAISFFVDSGRISARTGKEIIRKILYENAERLYRL